MKHINKLLVILWGVCLVLDIITGVTEGWNPLLFDLTLAHTCLIFNNLELDTLKK